MGDTREKRERLKLDGFCVQNHGKKSAEGKVLCQDCLDTRKRARAFRKEKGLCQAGCGQAAVRAGKCEPCRVRHIATRFNLTPQDFVRLYDAFPKCCVCGRDDNRLVIDHDHETGEIRGILCHQCNSVIGLASESSERLLALVAYLDNPPAADVLSAS